MMTDILWIAVYGLFFVLFGIHFIYWKDARNSRRDSSRFDMFAVRDRLVFLVASKRMSEDDPAWQIMYETVNTTLDISYQTTILGQLVRRARYATKIARDSEYADRVNKIDELLKAAARKTPAFSKIISQLDSALYSMARARTPTWQWWILLILVLVVVPYTFLRRAARELFFHQRAAVAALAAVQRTQHLAAV